MKLKTIFLSAVLATGVNVAQAFDMGDMMDPGEWFGNNDRDYYDRGYYGRGYGPYGYGGPYGGWGGPYGGGPYGWGGPYGYGGYPGAYMVNPGQGGNTAPPPRLPE